MGLLSWLFGRKRNKSHRRGNFNERNTPYDNAAIGAAFVASQSDMSNSATPYADYINNSGGGNDSQSNSFEGFGGGETGGSGGSGDWGSPGDSGSSYDSSSSNDSSGSFNSD